MTSNFDLMSVDELWTLHEELRKLLSEKINAERQHLEARLSLLHRNTLVRTRSKKIPQPKYQNPENPSQTWSGLGRRPTWIVRLVKAGKRLDEVRFARKSRDRR